MNNIRHKYTKKILALSILPLVIMTFVLIAFFYLSSHWLINDISTKSGNELETIYRAMLEKRGEDISEKLRLQIQQVTNELTILTASYQKLIDEEYDVNILLKNIGETEYFNHKFNYNEQKNWSYSVANRDNLGVSIWGYQHDQSGVIDAETLYYLRQQALMKPIVQAIREDGVEKSWIYLVGPKATPSVSASPWAVYTEMFDKKYPGHNEKNWWDFFFPGMVENWQAWLDDENARIGLLETEMTVTPLYEDAAGDGLMISFFKPLWNKARTENYGAVAIDYNIIHLLNLVENESIGASGFSFLMQKDGNVLGIRDQDARLLGLEKMIIEEEGVRHIAQNLFQSNASSVTNSRIPTGNNFFVNNIETMEGKFLLGFKEVIAFNLWRGEDIVREPLYLGVVLTEDEVFAVRNQAVESLESRFQLTAITAVLATFVIVLLVAFVSIWISLRETKQIRLLSEVIQAVKNKRYDTQALVVAKDELGELTALFNDMVTETYRNHKQLEQYTERLEKMAFTDGLTSLANRERLRALVEQEITNCQEYGGEFALLMIDLDNFKTVNDSQGHNIGDQLLVKIANKLAQQLHDDHLIARWGGDEFVVLLRNIHALDNAERVARQIVSVLRQPVQINAQELYIGGSIGIALYPQHGKDYEVLTKHADIAMYEAKNKGGDNFQTFTPALQNAVVERIKLEDKIRKGLTLKEFALFYQPKFDLANNEIMGAEVLVRWNSAESGIILPDKFIPAAENSNLILPLGETILETSIQRAAEGLNIGRSVKIAINLSPKQFQQSNFISVLHDILNRTQVNPELLEFEITESMVMQDIDTSVALMKKIRDLGISLSIDDFGTGYSSLSYLKKFPVNSLKIDQSFVRDMETNVDDRAIVRAIIALGHNLGLKIVAEGVETEQQLELLREWGCHYAQGYLLGKPMSYEDFGVLLRQ